MSRPRAASAPSAAAVTCPDPKSLAFLACEALADEANSESISAALSRARSAKRSSIVPRALDCELCSEVPRPTRAASVSSAAIHSAGVAPRTNARSARKPWPRDGTRVYRQPAGSGLEDGGPIWPPVGRPARRRCGSAGRRAQAPWHFLNFLPDPHQHGSLRPIVCSSESTRCSTGGGSSSSS